MNERVNEALENFFTVVGALETRAEAAERERDELRAQREEVLAAVGAWHVTAAGMRESDAARLLNEACTDIARALGVRT